jgi:hypothetical protein
MVQLIKITRSPNEGSLHIYAYGLAAPATGANDVSYTGAQQTTTPLDATASSNGSGSAGTSIATAITTVLDNTAVCGFAVMDNGGTNASTNASEVGNNTAGDGYITWESTTFPKTPAGATTYTVTGNNANRGQVVISIEPTSLAASTALAIGAAF